MSATESGGVVLEDQWIGPRPSVPTLETEVLRQMLQDAQDREIMLRMELTRALRSGNEGRRP